MAAKLPSIDPDHMLLCPNWPPPDPRGTFIATALAGEAGELASLFKKEWRDGFIPERCQQMVDELGDVVAYARMMGKHLGVDIIRISEDNLKAFERRPGYKELLKEARRRSKEAFMGTAHRK